MTFSPFWCGHDRSRRHTRHHHQSRLKWNNVRICANEHRKSAIRRQKKLHIEIPDSPLPLEELPLFALFLGVSVARLFAKAPSSTTVRTVVVAEPFKSPRCRKQLCKLLKIFRYKYLNINQSVRYKNHHLCNLLVSIAPT